MNFSFIKTIVEYVETRLDCPRRKFLFSMTTNAILLHRYMDYLVEHDFHILVSLDGNEKNEGKIRQVYTEDSIGREHFRLKQIIDRYCDKEHECDRHTKTE